MQFLCMTLLLCALYSVCSLPSSFPGQIFRYSFINFCRYWRKRRPLSSPYKCRAALPDKHTDSHLQLRTQTPAHCTHIKSFQLSCQLLLTQIYFSTMRSLVLLHYCTAIQINRVICKCQSDLTGINSVVMFNICSLLFQRWLGVNRFGPWCNYWIELSLSL